MTRWYPQFLPPESLQHTTTMNSSWRDVIGYEHDYDTQFQKLVEPYRLFDCASIYDVCVMQNFDFFNKSDFIPRFRTRLFGREYNIFHIFDDTAIVQQSFK